MLVLLNGKTFESPLPHMPMTTIVPMIATDMAGHPPLHKRAEAGVAGWLQDKMKMIGHQAEGEQLHRILRFGSGEQIQKGPVIPIGMKHGRAAVAAIEDMEGVASEMAARYAGHGGEGKRERGGMQRKSSLSPFLCT